MYVYTKNSSKKTRTTNFYQTTYTCQADGPIQFPDLPDLSSPRKPYYLIILRWNSQHKNPQKKNLVYKKREIVN